MDMTDNKNDELATNLNRSSKVKTPAVEKPGDGEPDGRVVESDAGVIPELKNPGKEKFSIPELPELKVLEYANKIRAFIGLEGGPNDASDFTENNGNNESGEHQSLNSELDENAVGKIEQLDENEAGKSEHEPVSNLFLSQPNVIDNTDKSNIYIPTVDNGDDCSADVEDDAILVNKELKDEPSTLASINANLEEDAAKGDEQSLNDDGDIFTSKGVDDQPDTLTISNKNVNDSEFSEDGFCGNKLRDNKRNYNFGAEKNDSHLELTENNLEKAQITQKDDVLCDSMKKNDNQKLDNIIKIPLFDSKKNNEQEIPETQSHDVCATVENGLNCSEDSDDVVNHSQKSGAKIASVTNMSSKLSNGSVDLMEGVRDSGDSINLNDSMTNENFDNNNLVKLTDFSLEFPKKDQDSSVLKEPVLFYGEEISLKGLDTNNASVKEDESCSNFKIDSKDLIDSEEINQGIEKTPNIEQLRRLSSEIVSRVLDGAENKLKNILKKAPKENINVNQLSSEDTIPEKSTITSEFNENFSGLHNVEQYVDPDTVCGIGSFKPQWLQPWATAKVYLVLYSIIGILSGSYYSYLIGSISTLEKRFAFKSKLSGSVMVVDEITPLFLGVLVGYFGGRAHRPRMVALGMMMSSLACFVSALPYFIYGTANHLHSASFQNTTEFHKCEADVKVEECDADDRPPTLAAVLFLMLGSFLKGFGNLAYYAVGLAYMDDNAKKKNTPMYFAFAYALRLLGPLVGFLMSYSFLKYYENPFVDPGFGPEDPRWIGGWWMGFMLQGVLLMICSAPIALFPRRLPGHKLAGTTVRKGEGLVSNLAGLWAALKRLGKNPLFIFLVINTIFSIYGGFGHYIMLPKYMENQFRVSASQASLLSGPPGLAALIVATLIGGYLIYRFRPNAKFLTGCLVILETIRTVGFLILMIPKCESIQMSNYGWDGQGLILEGSCNTNCSCSTKAFTPVCAPDGKTHFFSPCHAGCHGKVNETFTECSCIADSFGLGEDSTTEGFCITHGCWNQALIYIITLPIISFICNLLRVADTMVFLRCIKTEDKSVALGTYETFLSAFGFIPYPVVFGALVDSACLVWEKSCGQTGNCWFYDITKFNYLLHGSSALFTGLSALCMFVVFCLSGKVDDLYKEDEDMDENMKEQNVKEVQEEVDDFVIRF